MRIESALTPEERAEWPKMLERRKRVYTLQAGDNVGALWADFDALLAIIRRLDALVSKCGGENCMGWRLDGCANWVTQDRYDVLQAREARLREALIAAKKHLEYCGYGDSYEREGARNSKLPETINAALAEPKE